MKKKYIKLVSKSVVLLVVAAAAAWWFAEVFPPGPYVWTQSYLDSLAFWARRDPSVLAAWRRSEGNEAWQALRAYLRGEDERMGIKPNRFPKTDEEK